MGDTPETHVTTVEPQWGESYEAKVKQFEQGLKDLTDQIDNNDQWAKESLQHLIDEWFYSWLEKFKAEDPEKFKEFVNSISEAIRNLVEKYKDQVPEDLNNLMEFLKKVGEDLQISQSNAPSEWSDGVEKPKIELQWNLDWVKAPETGQSPVQDFRGGIKKDKPAEWEQAPDEKLRLYEVIEKGWTLVKTIDELLNKEWLDASTKENLSNIKKQLENIKQVIDNTTPENVKSLQNYIFENVYKGLDPKDEGRMEFEAKNRLKNNEFDGKFGVATLKWLKALGEKFTKYVDDVKKTIDQGSGSWWDVTPQDGAVDNWPQTPQPALDTSPITIGNQQFLAMENTSQLASSLWLTWCVLYSTINAPATSGEEWEQLQHSTESKNSAREGFTEYYVKKWDQTYKIEVKDNVIFPITERMNGNWSVESRDLIENNQACLNYLNSQIPEGLRGKVAIGRNSKYKDYTLSSYDQTLTIEPMTIDWKWVSPKLSDCLAFLNFTNFLRSDESHIDNKELKWAYPDLKIIDWELKVRVKKSGEKKEKWYGIPSTFCLDGITDEWILSKFKKYNNHEDWNDNWDRKKLNSDYGTVRLSWDIPVTATSVAAGGSNSPVWDRSSRVAGAGGGSPVDASKEGTDATELGEVVVVSTIFKPKNPLISGEKIEWDVLDGGDAVLDWVWKFEDWKFKFDDNIQESSTDSDESGWTTIVYNEKSYKKYEYKRDNEGNLVLDSNFNWNWYRTWEITYRGDSAEGEEGKKISCFYIWWYKDGLKDWDWTIIFENGAKYVWNWKEWKEQWPWVYTYIDWNTYEWSFSSGKFDGEWTYTVKRDEESGGNVVLKWTFVDNKFVSWDLTIGSETYKVERTDEWLEIKDWENGTWKYIDIESWKVKDDSGEGDHSNEDSRS